ncbi:unnamed protein product [Moneuplotes crassus]|uniref:Uncharacterized protein n=1 Tax=Euplotes crassus TaxID=5936 RepID=A0A7S3K868_EUPCR|nr:unnamed protein product [Moneuplotes crassus]|mmetsp:Transcript_14276/g.14261  ORF Transcript_14276/g.14261 Transcript_14276/m.14261 type:complete len:104 (+) Transcript_14276:24-335(+)|eukprot:CAMPEP_0197004654 /NCGR_PEP_ID=MMETSP1380-20130617/24535_1 /TAXON_ID=5936 /ORGANISM="Euplotes crassus, Strain CT5" /LENGTH=103 /DNA_ID=CAMNT_0042423521 /DNA_START=24 /DNA_END=335 /DNA_ORIENTATION=-
MTKSHSSGFIPGGLFGFFLAMAARKQLGQRLLQNPLVYPSTFIFMGLTTMLFNYQRRCMLEYSLVKEDGMMFNTYIHHMNHAIIGEEEEHGQLHEFIVGHSVR